MKYTWTIYPLEGTNFLSLSHSLLKTCISKFLPRDCGVSWCVVLMLSLQTATRWQCFRTLISWEGRAQPWPRRHHWQRGYLIWYRLCLLFKRFGMKTWKAEEMVIWIVLVIIPRLEHPVSRSSCPLELLFSCLSGTLVAVFLSLSVLSRMRHWLHLTYMPVTTRH